MSEQNSTTEMTHIYVDRTGMPPFTVSVPSGQPAEFVRLAIRHWQPQHADRPLKEWEVYTLEQSWPIGDVEANVNCDRLLAAKLNDGWEPMHFTSRMGEGSVRVFVAMKRRTPCPKCGELGRGADAFCSNRDCSDYLGW